MEKNRVRVMQKLVHGEFQRTIDADCTKLQEYVQICSYCAEKFNKEGKQELKTIQR